MELPVVVIGAGPQGLAAAAQLLERGIEPVVFETGQSVGAAVAEWGQVRLFSSWPELVDAAAARLLVEAAEESSSGECCAPAPQVVQIGARAAG